MHWSANGCQSPRVRARPQSRGDRARTSNNVAARPGSLSRELEAGQSDTAIRSSRWRVEVEVKVAIVLRPQAPSIGAFGEHGEGSNAPMMLAYSSAAAVGQECRVGSHSRISGTMPKEAGRVWRLWCGLRPSAEIGAANFCRTNPIFSSYNHGPASIRLASSLGGSAGWPCCVGLGACGGSCAGWQEIARARRVERQKLQNEPNFLELNQGSRVKRSFRRRFGRAYGRAFKPAKVLL
jgi:hypothetical protein